MLEGFVETLRGLAPAPLKWLWGKLQPYNPLLFFAAGFGYDSVTLRRIDQLIDNYILLVYLILLGLMIVLAQRVELEKIKSERIRKLAPYFNLAVHFFFGGLFSAYVIYYFKSASFTRAILFLIILVALMLLNEFLHDHLKNIHLMATLYFLCVFSFLLYFIPVMTGWMNSYIFFIAGLGALAAVGLTTALIYLGGLKESLPELRRTGIAVGIVFGALLVLYLGRVIPPVPLSLKYRGIYHKVHWIKKDRRYELTRTKKPWYALYDDDRTYVKEDGDTVYCFTAVFAPAAMTTRIVHRWRPYDEAEGDYSEGETIPMQIVGGREEGFRGYTLKRHTHPGQWLVDVETADGRVLGSIAFEIRNMEKGEKRELEKEYY